MMSGAPCRALEEETEQAAVEAGWNTLVGCDLERIGRAHKAQQGKAHAWPFGNGRAAERIAGLLEGGLRWWTP